MNRFRRWALVLAAVVIAAVGMARLQFDVEILNLLPRQVPEVQGLALYNTHFSNARELVLSVQGEDASEVAETAQQITLELRRHTNLISQAHWQPPWEENTQQIAPLLAYLWFNSAPDEFRQLLTRLEPERVADQLANARQRLATSFSPDEIARLSFDPLGLTDLPGLSGSIPMQGGKDSMFAADDGTFRLVFVQARDELGDYRECAEWFSFVQHQVADLRKNGLLPPTTRVNYTGRPAFVADISQGMQRDMTRSILGTAGIVALLFWGAHRRWKPLVWLMVLMTSAIGITLILGGLIYGALNVLSVGFAAILLGIAADYAMVLYQENQCESSDPDVPTGTSARRGVLWSALTTAAAFLMLNLSGLPGLAQLGTLVAIGVLVAAALILWLYLKPLNSNQKTCEPESTPRPRSFVTPRFLSQSGWLATLLVLFASLVLLRNGFPSLDRTANSLRPRQSEAYSTLDQIQQRMSSNRDSLWLITSGTNETEVAALLDQSVQELKRAKSDGVIADFTMPAELWPRPEFQEANQSELTSIINAWPAARNAVLSAGFTTNAVMLADNLFASLAESGERHSVWPTGEAAVWSLEKFTAKNRPDLHALGLVYPAEGRTQAMLNLDLPRNVLLVGWNGLGTAMANIVRHDLPRVLLPTGAVLIICLTLAFRRPGEVLLSLGSLAFGLLALGCLMKMVGWTWNLLNMMALPLLLGVGVDYSIHMQLALRRYGGDQKRTRQSIGRALFLCAATTVTAFGSLSLSNNAGMASLGKVCASGVAITYVTATLILPAWWRTLRKREVQGEANKHSSVEGPSSFYSRRMWEIGLTLARLLPRVLIISALKVATQLYASVAAHRRTTVEGNLAPILADKTIVQTKARRLFSNFAVKLTDLWRYESGLNISDRFGQLTGIEHLAGTNGRGILLVTPHLGNWEFGAPLLAEEGFKILVITLTEPDKGLTELRKASRAQWNIETVVIGSDPFGFVEVIRRLEAGAIVALLVDRPTTSSKVEVKLFGQSIAASTAPAELARATGCQIVPVYIVQEDELYTARAMEPIPYDRAALRDKKRIKDLTQQIMRAFEKPIRQYADQWYHFVPIWPNSEDQEDGPRESFSR